jgi:hypothetical protein
VGSQGRRPALPTVKESRAEEDGISVAELVLVFMRYAEGYYRRPDGMPTPSVNKFVLSLRPLNHLCGTEPVKNIGPLKLKAVRELMVKGDVHPDYGEQPSLCRRVVYTRIQRLTQCLKWAGAKNCCPSRSTSLEVDPGLASVLMLTVVAHMTLSGARSWHLRRSARMATVAVWSRAGSAFFRRSHPCR